MTLVHEFQAYANSLKSGYLKHWKALGIINTLTDMPEVMQDEVRFLSYLKNCLYMEGFSTVHIELIMGWLYERLNNG